MSELRLPLCKVCSSAAHTAAAHTAATTSAAHGHQPTAGRRWLPAGLPRAPTGVGRSAAEEAALAGGEGAAVDEGQAFRLNRASDRDQAELVLLHLLLHERRSPTTLRQRAAELFVSTAEQLRTLPLSADSASTAELPLEARRGPESSGGDVTLATHLSTPMRRKILHALLEPPSELSALSVLKPLEQVSK